MTEQQLQLPQGQTIAYLLEYRSRKSIGLTITERGLLVHAPKRISTSYLQQILLKKSPWILKKLAQREANQTTPMQWLDGESLLWMGELITLHIIASPANKAVQQEGAKLIVRTTQPNNTTLIARKVMQWYAQQALPDFTRRVQLVATHIGVQASEVSLSNAKSRWGSCNSRKQIRLNWRLIQAPPHIIQYVVCHEMAHLKEMNHSSKFYAVLADLFPSYLQVEKELKALSTTLYRMALPH